MNTSTNHPIGQEDVAGAAALRSPSCEGVVPAELRKAKRIAELWLGPRNAAKEAEWEELTDDRTFSTEIGFGLILDLLSATPAPETPPADADVIAALRALYEWYDRDGSVGGASQVFEDHRAALTRLEASQPASSGSEFRFSNEQLRKVDDALHEFARAAIATQKITDHSKAWEALRTCTRAIEGVLSATPPRDLAAAPGGELGKLLYDAVKDSVGPFFSTWAEHDETTHKSWNKIAADFLHAASPVADKPPADAGLVSAHAKHVERLRNQIEAERKRADDNYSYAEEQLKRADAAEAALARATGGQHG